MEFDELDNLETGAQDPAAEGQNQDGDKMVPLSVIQAIREELKTVKEQNQLYLAQLRMGMAGQYGQQNRGPAQEEEDDFLPGIDPDEPLTKKEIAKAFKGLSQRIEYRTNAMSDETSFLARHPDYHEVITQHLPKLFEQKPELLARLQRHPDPVLAYELGVNSPSYRAKKAKEKIAQDDKGKTAQENAKKPGSPSQVTGQTGQDARDKIANMSREEFRAYMERVKRGGH